MPIAFLPTVCSNTHPGFSGSVSVINFPDWWLLRVEDFLTKPSTWPNVQREESFWLRGKTLEFLHRHPQGVSTNGLLLVNKSRDIKILLTEQVFHFNLAGQVSDNAKGATSRFDFRRRLLSPFSFKILCIGQFLTSGDYCQEGIKQLEPAVAAQLLSSVAETILQHDHSYTGVLLKDLFATQSSSTALLRKRGYYLLPTDPIMELNVRQNWKSTKDYLSSLSSKYRIRYRRARGKLAGMASRDLSPGEVQSHLPRIYELYRLTTSGADFNAAKLDTSYFSWLSRQEEVTIRGYFDQNGRMVAFTSTIDNGPTMHAHYLGMEDAFKRSHHLYHNILYDLLESAIQKGVRKLDYGRTALEIKSSLGAVPVAAASLLKARSGFINKLIPLFTPAVYSPQKWTPRNPYKKSTANN